MSSNRTGPVVSLPDVLFNGRLPTSLEAEMCLIGSALLGDDVLGELSGAVKPEAFHSVAHQVIWSHMLGIHKAHGAIDLGMLVAALKSSDGLEDVGGADYLVQLAEEVPSSVNWPHYASIVLSRHRLRTVIAAAGEVIHTCYTSQDGADSTRNDDEIVRQCEQTFYAATEKAALAQKKTMAALLEEAFATLTDQNPSERVIQTEFTPLDDLTGGWRPGQLVVVAARPSIGKSQLAVQFTLHAALAHKARPLLFSFEMDAASIVLRALATEAGVPHRPGAITKEYAESIGKAKAELEANPFEVVSASGLSVTHMQSIVRREKARSGVGMVVVDYLQLVRGDQAKRENRQTEVADISRGLKAMAMEFGVPVIALAQLNRESEKREGNRPRLSDLRESGAIEQDADIVLLLHREEHHHIGDADWSKVNQDKEGLAEIFIAKNRSGRVGRVELGWSHKLSRFEAQRPVVHGRERSYDPFERDREEADVPF